MLPRPLRQESLSKAYVRAIAAKAGLICVDLEYDFGIDLAFRMVVQQGGRFRDGGVQANFQIKSTTRASMTHDTVVYDLDAQTYEDLRQRSESGAVWLILFVMPDDEDLWLTQNADQLVLRHCAYWHYLAGQSPTQATRSVRVTIPTSNVFSVAFAEALMQQLFERNQT